MKFSEMWLREWVNPPINTTNLINQLTILGFKVDTLQSVSKNFYGIIIGQIIECIPHPNIVNTWITKVNIGQKKLLNIICNTISCRINTKVVVATIGAILPNGHKIILTTTASEKISDGILCTFKMLGIEDNTQNIIELPKNAPIGKNFYNYFHLYDKIIDVDITPNRGDCLNILGMAREIAVINNIKTKNIKIYTNTPIVNNTIAVSINTPKKCPKYLVRIIKKINTAIPTPLWIKEKLRRCGIYSINIVTDITNYVLIELGYPIHAFDYEKITGNIIKVRFNTPEETSILYNKKTFKLLPNTLIIADNKKILSIAGLITSDQFCIYPIHTNNIVLQSAFFTPSIITHQSKLYNIYNLSSIRYARGVDPYISQLALERVTFLLLKYCNGYPGPIVEITNKNFLPIPTPIILHRSTIDKMLGFHIKNQEIFKILKNLGFQIKLLKQDCWKILYPTWRFDISIEENIVAEIIRVYGYNKIPNTTINTNLIVPNNQTSPTIPLSKIKSLLIHRGYQEIITYSFVNPDVQKILFPMENPLILKNPITKNMSSMRLSLWIGLIETMIYNKNRQQKNIKLFESGICFTPHTNKNKKINQNFMIAGLRSGSRFHEHWDIAKYLVDFYDIKGDIEAILHATNKFGYITFKKSTHTALHPTQNSAIYLNNNTSSICIGYIGSIHPAIQIKLNIQPHILVFEIAWDVISNIKLPKISVVSKFPKNFRDISIIVSDTISYESIINICKKIIADLLIDITISDVYKNKNIPQDYKSLTIKFTLQSKTHTLKENEISNIISQCLIALKRNLKIIVR